MQLATRSKAIFSKKIATRKSNSAADDSSLLARSRCFCLSCQFQPPLAFFSATTRDTRWRACATFPSTVFPSDKEIYPSSNHPALQTFERRLSIGWRICSLVSTLTWSQGNLWLVSGKPFILFPQGHVIPCSRHLVHQHFFPFIFPMN